MATFPEIPPALKSITGIMQTAANHEKIDPVITYWCRLYAMQQGLKIDSSSKECKAYLIAVMDWLEKYKKANKNNELIMNDLVAQAHMEGHAMKLFDRADAEDRSGNANRNTSKLFFTASQIFDSLAVFGDGVSEEVAQKSKYAKWRAAYIIKCIKSGDKPIPPEAGTENEDQLGQPFDDLNVPAAPSITDNSQIGASASASYITSNVSAPIAESNTSSNLTTSAGTHLSPQAMIQAQKYCKWASSALQYEDVPTAITNLEKALTLLKTGEELA